jgi:hypothetical protein
MISSKARTIRQYCSVCKATLEMAVVDTVQDHEVTWLKCPRCNGILPHMMSSDDLPQAVETPPVDTPPVAVAVQSEAPAAIPEADRGTARDYDPTQNYAVGEVVYHRSLNQFGRVVEKMALPGKRSVIRVQFDGGEAMQLRESV